MTDTVVVVNFSEKDSLTIARKIRGFSCYSEVISVEEAADRIKMLRPKGIIFSDSDSSVTRLDHPDIEKSVYELGIPILGIGFGAELICKHFGGEVKRGARKEVGKVVIEYAGSILFRNISYTNIAYMSHSDYIVELPEDFIVTSHTKNTKISSFENRTKHIYGVQFLPQREENFQGDKIIENFIFDICKSEANFVEEDFIEKVVQSLRDAIGDKKAICTLSGGVASFVAALITQKAIGDNLYLLFIDNGLLRYEETRKIKTIFEEKFKNNLIQVDAKDRFMEKLKGIKNYKDKKKIIESELINIFNEEASKIDGVSYIVQGTTYQTLVEERRETGNIIVKAKDTIGTYVNLDYDIIEPLGQLFKEEVRKVGMVLGVSEKFMHRHSFPRTGFGNRILGEITKEKCEMISLADYIFREELDKIGLLNKIDTAFAVLPNTKTMGVVGGSEQITRVIVLRAINFKNDKVENFPIPYELLEKISDRIINEVEGISRVCYDISTDIATIEWR